MSIADRLTVALVEDDRLLREEIESHLTAHGFVVHAANSASALDDILGATLNEMLAKLEMVR